LIGLFDKVKNMKQLQSANLAVALLDRAETCRFFGGTRPIHPATLYRNIRLGRFPRPVKVGPGTSRWLRDECEAALAAMVEARS
jgi:predicted DNA-binding transcriptional regulator AlpA